MTTDSDFYARRITEARAAAANAAIGKLHIELAGLYEEKLKALSSENEPSPRPKLRMVFDNTKLTATG